MPLNACRGSRIPGPASQLSPADLGFGGTVDDRVAGVAADPGPQQAAVRGAALGAELPLEDLVGRGGRQAVGGPDVPRPGLGREIRLAGQKLTEVARRQ